MIRKSLPIGLLFALAVLFGVSQGSALMLCSDCQCSHSCNTYCMDDDGWFSGCVNTGICMGSPACSEGNASAAAPDTSTFLASLRGESPAAAPACQPSAVP